MNRKKLAIWTVSALLGWFTVGRSECAISLTGPIISNAAVVSGSVTVSSMTVSSMTVQNSMQVSGTINGVKGLVCQTVSTSTVVASTTTSTSLVSIPGMSANITLLNSRDYVRISISGSLQAFSLLSPPSYAPEAHLSLARDGVDLGHGALATTANAFVTPVGYMMIDSPGDTTTHAYAVTFNVSNSSTTMVAFTASPVGYLILEEVSR